MSEKHLYLLLDLLALAGPLGLSFHPRSRYYRTWFALFPAIVVVGVAFLLWDHAFTRMGVWGFEPRYLLGVYLGALPMEECLFFVVVPYASLFTYHSTKVLSRPDFFQAARRPISFVLVLGLGVVALGAGWRWYTSVTFGALALLVFWLEWVVRKHFLARFYFAYLLTIVPLLLMNGALTGSFTPQPVVWYDNTQNLALRIGTIPIEDFFYGMLLLLLVSTAYEYLLHRGKHPAADWGKA